MPRLPTDGERQDHARWCPGHLHTAIGKQNMGESQAVSALGPVDPASVPEAEQERTAPWIVRKLVGSMTGRIVMSSWETLRASGISVWGDSSPLLLPCIRFRDLAVHTIIAATGGVAAVAAPVMGPVSDAIVSSLGDTVLVEVGAHLGFELTSKVANDMILDKAIKEVVPIHSDRLHSTNVKELLITLTYKHTMEDASLGFYRSSVHADHSLFSSVLSYLATEKGWFSPYLFASSRRPLIPRTMKPDVVFCHGPFLPGDYRVGEVLLAESASVISFSPATPSPVSPSSHASLSVPSRTDLPTLSNLFSRSRTPSPEPELTPLPAPSAPRRMVVLVLGLKPHRAGMWTTSARPSESVMYYQLLNGCPALVVPVKLGSPLIAWDTLTLEQLWKVRLPREDEVGSGGKFGGIVDVISEFLDLCVDWDRVVLSAQLSGTDASTVQDGVSAEATKKAVKEAVTLLVASAIRSGESKEVKSKVDKERSGIAMWRIP